MKSYRLDRLVQVTRFEVQGRDPAGGLVGEWLLIGDPIPASRTDVSDRETFVAGLQDNKLMTRFVVRATDTTRAIRRSDKLDHEGIRFRIEGIKEVPSPRRAFLEITAASADPL